MFRNLFSRILFFFLSFSSVFFFIINFFVVTSYFWNETCYAENNNNNVITQQNATQTLNKYREVTKGRKNMIQRRRKKAEFFTLQIITMMMIMAKHSKNTPFKTNTECGEERSKKKKNKWSPNQKLRRYEIKRCVFFVLSKNSGRWQWLNVNSIQIIIYSNIFEQRYYQSHVASHSQMIRIVLFASLSLSFSISDWP